MKVLICTGIDALDEMLERLGQEQHDICITDNLDELELVLEDQDVIVVNRYMDESIDGGALLRKIKYCRNRNKNLQVILLMAEKEVQFIQTMVSIGIYDIVLCDQGESLEKVSSKLLKAIETPATSFNFDLLKETEPVLANQQTEKQESRTNFLKVPQKVIVESVFKQIITVYSPTNAGGSALVEDLANALTKHKKCKALMIDLNTLNPMLSMKLNKMGKDGLHELLDAYEKGAPLHEVEDQYINKVGDVYLLANSFNYNHCYYLKTELLERLIMALQRHYDYIILDVNPYLNDAATQTALTVASQTYLVSLPNHANLNVSMGYLKLIREELKTSHITGVIINNFSGFCLTSIEIESVVENVPISYIPTAKANARKGFRAKRYYKHFSRLVTQIEGGTA